jgi:DNA primase
MSEDQMGILKHWGLTPVLCFDADAAGIKGINKTLNMLSDNGIYAKVLPLPNGKDLAETALYYKNALLDYVESHTLSYWEYSLKTPAELYMIQLNEARRKVLPLILNARQSIHDNNDEIIFNEYIYQTFGIRV